MNAIQTVNLSKHYESTVALNNLNLSVEKGELFALLGVNGAGKTTTIKMLCCLSEPTSGDAFILGKSILREPNAVKQLINVSPQETAVARILSVKENLIMIAKIYGIDADKANEKADQMIETFHLHEVKDKKASTLSGGMQRRLSIAMALITDPKILFLDEPTLGLDVLARRELWNAIRKLKGKITIILTTHYMEEAEALSDRIGILYKGELKAVGTASELMAVSNTKTFEDAFVALVSDEEVQQ